MGLRKFILAFVFSMFFYGIFAQNVTLYAGLPSQAGFSPTNQPKLSFYFNQPYGLAFDSKGNLWVSNRSSHTVCVICASGNSVYSKTGSNSNGFRNGNASYALFYDPAGIAIGPGDTLYVADASNHVIRKIEPLPVGSCAANLTVGVKAGLYSYFNASDPKYQSYPGFVNGAASVARFNEPMDVTVDAANNMYVADASNHCIRKISAAGIVSTFAGQCTKPGYRDDISDSAQFNYPVAVLLRPNGDLIVADEFNSKIRKISGGVVSTITTDSTFAPFGIAYHSNGTLFINDANHILTSTTTINKTFAGHYDKNGYGYVNGFGQTARFNQLKDLVFDPNNINIFYVADQDNQVIRKVAVCATYTPTVTATQTTFCAGDSAILTVQGTYNSYKWSTGETTKSIVAKTTASYTCTVTDVNTCPGISSPVAITTTTLNPNVTPDGPLTFCLGDSVMLVGEAGLNYYTWYNGATIVKQGTQGLAQTLIVKADGNYFLYGTRGFCQGNSATFKVTVGGTVVPSIKITGDTTLCPGDTVILETTTAFTSYSWKNGASTVGTQRKLLVTTAGNYSVYVTQTGCNGTSPKIQVTLHPAPTKPTINVSDTILTSSAATTYQWYRYGVKIAGATKQVLNATRNAQYRVETTNSNGCKAMSDKVNIGKVSIPKVDVRNYFEIYPNPTNGLFYIDFNEGKSATVSITISDIFGKTVISKTSDNYIGTRSLFDLSNFGKGMYFVTIKIGENTGTVKVILGY